MTHKSKTLRLSTGASTITTQEEKYNYAPMTGESSINETASELPEAES
jgi:hypothetical protein